MDYNKQPKTIEEQVELLRLRGLIIDDEEKLKKYLSHISYYHLSAYFKSFQKLPADDFKDDVNFEDILNIYVFDKKLRLLLLDILEIVEKSFKCKLIAKVALENGNSHWFLDVNLFQDQEKYDQYIKPVINKTKESKDEGIKHYYKKYNSPDCPPAWTLIDPLTFGEAVNIFRWLNTENRNKVSRDYDLDEKYLLSWMYGLSVLRNTCAHHSRLWNRELFAGVKQDPKLYAEFFNPRKRNRLYNYLVVLQIMAYKISPSSTWVDKLAKLIDEHEINIDYMGFPDDWIDRLNRIQ
ncbi:hypothetical protein COT94_02050 [Candidatus Falkowbacteria bacterium CG10_big_fil_rev_8_21_14_0_10_37_14]|uniref:DNA-binding protein n=1 Tax=Candidatus Falkowbacteria bacterium CG10_big_fil_rev_8_21_14_0_10_37_14 TaxID=1974561 RepID=A0A2M6WTH4_9BACT|nr:Abi family protein [Candidatus Falkowbacteria bacterium]PIT96026.1 MAG: hypothetical protein COT94_02050 [Candidatus Falkowbacteria bacterium CG10_big_fil_rev_8_21_14_0_10_37_14]